MPTCDLRARSGRIRTILPWFALGALIAAAPIEGGCADATMGRCPTGEDCDVVVDDGGGFITDASVGIDAASVPSIDAGVPTEADESALGSMACFNGLDDDGRLGADCEDTSCGAAPYCCVGGSSAACCVGEGVSATADFRTCSGTDVTACTSGARMFGDPQPGIEDEGLVPFGDQGDSGLILGDELDASRERITLRALLAASHTGCEGVDCVETVGVGIGDAPGADTTRIVPDVAVVVRASREDYALVVAGETLATWTLETSAPQLYELVLAPDGTATLRVGADASTLTEVTSVRYVPRAHVHALLYGRTTNRPGAPMNAAARAVQVDVSSRRCDIPSALERGSAPELPWPGQDPSVVMEGDSMLVAFEHLDSIHLARWDETDGWRIVGGRDLSEPALEADAGEQLLEPSLVIEEGRYALYVTRVAMSGGRTIQRAVGGAGYATTFGARTDVSLDALDGVHVESVSVIWRGGRHVMAATTQLDGELRIVLLASDDGGNTFGWANGTASSSTVVSPSHDLGRFDEQEVGQPDLAIDGSGLWRLHYAGRRGTRWGIGVRVSGDAETWREPTDGALVLRGSGRGFDALSVSSPSAAYGAGRVTLLYDATDGVEARIGRADGAAR